MLELNLPVTNSVFIIRVPFRMIPTIKNCIAQILPWLVNDTEVFRLRVSGNFLFVSDNVTLLMFQRAKFANTFNSNICRYQFYCVVSKGST